jgi:hypothetical protein
MIPESLVTSLIDRGLSARGRRRKGMMKSCGGLLLLMKLGLNSAEFLAG